MAITGNSIVIGSVEEGIFTPLAAVKSHDIQNGIDKIEKASATQGEWKEFTVGRKEWAINTSVLVLNNSLNNITDVLKVGKVYTLKSKDRHNRYSVQGKAICMQCKQTYSIGNLAYGAFAFQGTGPLTAETPGSVPAIVYGFADTYLNAYANGTRILNPETAVGTYSGTATQNGQWFFILVPTDISPLTLFTMGGAPFVMDAQTTVEIDGVTYYLRKSANWYNANTTLNIAAQ